jgi:hypothetical protein
MLEVDDGDSETFSCAGDLADRWSLFHDPAPTFWSWRAWYLWHLISISFCVMARTDPVASGEWALCVPSHPYLFHRPCGISAHLGPSAWSNCQLPPCTGVSARSMGCLQFCRVPIRSIISPMTLLGHGSNLTCNTRVRQHEFFSIPASLCKIPGERYGCPFLAGY